jgi:hypothetical protein
VDNIVDNFVAMWDRNEREAQAGMKTEGARESGVDVVCALLFGRPGLRLQISFRVRRIECVDGQRNVGRIQRAVAPHALQKWFG